MISEDLFFDPKEKRKERQEDRDFLWWKTRANFWGWVLGYGWGLADRHNDWAWNNWFLDREPKWWVIQLLANVYKD